MKKFLQNHCNLIFSIAINLAFFAILLCFCGVKYELSDDWFFSENIANGNANYVFCNYFIQFLSVAIQRFIYPYNAFIILQMALNFVALTTICYSIMSSFSFKKGCLFSIVIECVFAINAYSLVTFTKTAAILAIAGGVLMLWAYHDKKHIGYSILGIVLVVLGSLYRFQIFYSVLAMFCFCILALIVSKLRKPFVKSLADIIKEILTVRTVAIVLAMMIAVFAVDFVSDKIIYSEEGMDYYKEYNPARSAVLDYEIPLYENAVEQYEANCFSENDFYMLRSWYLDDEGYTDLETLHNIQQMQKDAKVGFDTLKYIKNMAYGEFMKIIRLSPEGILMLSYLIIAAAVLIVYKRNSWFFVGVITLGIGVLYLYLWLKGRGNYRATFSIWFASVVCLVYITRFLEYREWLLKAKERNGSFINTRLISACLAYSVVFLVVTTTVQFSKLAMENDDEYCDLNEYIVQSDKTFALSCSAYGKIRSATVLEDPLYIGEDEVFDKCIYFGSAYYAHPSYNAKLESIGVKNLYTDIIDNENIYYVDKTDIDMFVAYLNEQYGENESYGYELVKTADEFDIYKIITLDE